MRRKGLACMLMTAFVLVSLPWSSGAQEQDIAGTWKGSTEIPDMGTDEMTLVITREEEKIQATISDSLGMLLDNECEDLEFKEGTLTFRVTAYSDYTSLRVWITLDVAGDTMTGYWETEEGDRGTIELEKVSEAAFSFAVKRTGIFL